MNPQEHCGRMLAVMFDNPRRYVKMYFQYIQYCQYYVIVALVLVTRCPNKDLHLLVQVVGAVRYLVLEYYWVVIAGYS